MSKIFLRRKEDNTKKKKKENEKISYFTNIFYFDIGDKRLFNR